MCKKITKNVKKKLKKVVAFFDLNLAQLIAPPA
jgi:hypothetical protein